MIEHVERHPACAIGRSLSATRRTSCRWASARICRDARLDPKHFDFSGYVLGQHPQAFGPRDALRHSLGYRPDEKICIVTVGGSGVGTHLIARILQAWPLARARLPSCAWCWLPVAHRPAVAGRAG